MTGFDVSQSRFLRLENKQSSNVTSGWHGIQASSESSGPDGVGRVLDVEVTLSNRTMRLRVRTHNTHYHRDWDEE
jgi:hypothetical protein